MIPTKTGLFDHIHEILRLLKMSSTELVAYQEKNRNVKIQRFTILIIYLFIYCEPQDKVQPKKMFLSLE